MKTRPISVLLTLVLNDLKEYPNRCYGMCIVVAHLLDKKIIARNERDILFNYIHSNRPTVGSKFYLGSWGSKSYFWPTDDWAIRVEWLEHHIKLSKLSFTEGIIQLFKNLFK